MRIKILTLLIIAVSVHTNLQAEWVSMPASPISFTTHTLYHKQNGQVMQLAGGRGGVWLYKESNKQWNKIFNFESASSQAIRIRAIPEFPNLLYVCSDEGLWESKNYGKKWKKIFRRFDEKENTVKDVALAEGATHNMIVGARAGAFVSTDGGLTWQKQSDFNDQEIYQIEYSEGVFFVASEDGLTKLDSDFKLIETIYSRINNAEQNGNGQFALESTPLRPNAFGFLMPNKASSEIIILDQGILRETIRGFDAKEGSLNFPETIGLPESAENQIAYIPTRGGLMRVDGKKGDYANLSPTLPVEEIQSVSYDSVNDRLHALSDGKVFFLEHPTWEFNMNQMGYQGKESRKKIEAYFANEPSIIQLQAVAMRYAEVHPEKIQAWRNSVKKKAWFPEVGIGFDVGIDETVELDRGGTKDADYFINGPNERDQQWSIDVTWDLSELVWSSDQLSIDNRSKLGAQLRDDLLNRLVRLYFARRRLQIQSLLNPDSPQSQQIENDLLIREYTAGIDALTGGYFSKQLN